MKKNDAERNAVQNSMLNFCFCFHTTPPTDSIRMKRSEAQSIVLLNKSIVRDGNVRYFQIKDLGLGICEVKLRPIGKVNTFVVKTFET